MSWLNRLLLQILKVPPEPQPPPGASDTLRVFRSAPAYYRYSLVKWVLAQIGAVAGLFLSFGFISFAPIEILQRFDWVRSLELFFIPLLVIQGLATLALVRLRYELRWYMVSDQSLRIREGLYSVREQTMTIANIQNLAVHQGPIQKLFGIADLRVRTAGGGNSEAGEDGGDDPHLGQLTGLGNASEVRDLILQSLTTHRDSGLGDPDDARPARAEPPAGGRGADNAAAAQAAARLLEQVRGLRSDLSSAGV